MSKTYINMKNRDGSRETVDEFDTLREAKEMLSEYRMAFYGENLYLSARCCKNWRED